MTTSKKRILKKICSAWRNTQVKLPIETFFNQLKEGEIILKTLGSSREKADCPHYEDNSFGLASADLLGANQYFGSDPGSWPRPSSDGICFFADGHWTRKADSVRGGGYYEWGTWS